MEANLLQELSNSSDATTRENVAANPNTPTEVLLKLGGEFPEQLLGNPVFSRILYTKITVVSPGSSILPTAEQGLICIILCQSLTNFYRPILLLRLDERTGNIFILAGEELQVEVIRSGRWSFVT